MPAYTVGELAAHVSGAVEGDAGRRVSSVAPAGRAGPSDLAFATSERYLRLLSDRRPGAVLLPPGLELAREDIPVIRVDSPRLALVRILDLLHPEPSPTPRVHPTATLGPGVALGEAVSIGPFSVLDAGARVGAGSRMGASCFVGEGVEIGRDCRIAHGCSLLPGTRVGDRVRLHPGVRLGTEGFGYAEGSEGRLKVPQVGGCRIEEDVEIGANSTVDRGTLGDTVVGAGTKIDNLVHVGHNVRIGRDCVIVAQVGIAGSVEVGDATVLAGQAGIADHLKIGDRVRIAAQAGVIGDVPDGATYSGYPARPHAEAMRASAALLRLPEALRRLRELEGRLGVERPPTRPGGPSGGSRRSGTEGRPR